MSPQFSDRHNAALASCFYRMTGGGKKLIAPTPPNFRGVLLNAVQSHFSNPENYGADLAFMKGILWSEDEARRTLLIDYVDSYDEKTFNQKPPAILIGVEDVTFTHKVIDKKTGQAPDNSFEIQSDDAVLPFSVNIYGSTVDESWTLALHVTLVLNGLRHLFFDSIADIRQFEINHISKPTLLDPTRSERSFKAKVSGRIAYTNSWRAYMEGLRVKFVSVKVTDMIAP